MNKSKIRIRLKKNDFLKLTEEYNNKFKQQSNLFGDTPKSDEDILNTNLDIVILETDESEDMVYFGWDDIDWENYNENICFIKHFVKSCSVWAMTKVEIDTCRASESAEGIDCISTEITFPDDDISEL